MNYASAILVSVLLVAGAACAPVEDATQIVTPGQDGPIKACRVEDYQRYVGANRSTVPAAPQGQVFRSLCSTCAATMDYRENRVNFVYDDATGVIKEVKCG